MPGPWASPNIDLVATFASLPAASPANKGWLAYVQDIGAYGSYWYSTGVLWFPAHDIPLYTYADATGLAVGTSETQVGSTITLPAKSVPAGCGLRIRAFYGFASSSAGTGRGLRLRMGSNSGAPLSNTVISVYTETNTANVSKFIDKVSPRVSATQVLPPNNAQPGTYSTTGDYSPAAVENMDSATNYLCASAQSGSGDTGFTVYQLSIALVRL